MTPGDRYLYRKLLAEFLGTAYLVMTICLAKGYNEAVPAIVVSVTCSTGIISGAFFNPAVALGAMVKSWIEKDIDWATIRLYIVVMLVELLGAVSGAFYAFGISGMTFRISKNPGCSIGGAFLAEVIGSTTLVAMAMMVQEHRPNIIVGVMCVAGSILATIQWDTSGAVMNPAFGFGTMLADVTNHDSSRFENLWIYLTAPMVGGVLGSLLNAVYMVEVRSLRAAAGKGSSPSNEIPLKGANDEPMMSGAKDSPLESLNRRLLEPTSTPLESQEDRM
jgi:glycerol uptake facilitator-like aquaporin